MPSADSQLHAIHAMLAAGHRNLRIERHTLMLWGIPAGLLFALSESILTRDQFPDNTQRAIAWLALLLVVLAAIAAADWSWTRRIKAERDEAWSLIHRQVLKVLWLMMGLATLTTFAMFFYGGGYMLCAVWLVFLGVGLYVHGLFSEELLEWAGLLSILIGIASLLAGLPYETMRWVAAAVFGIGLPLLALMLDRGCHRPVLVRLGQILLWLGAVLVLPVWAETQLHRQQDADIPVLSLADYQARPPQTSGRLAVSLPAGTRIPVAIDVQGDIFEPLLPPAAFALTLARPLEVMLEDGKLSGDARLPGETWRQQSRQVRWISIPWIRGDLSPQRGPVVNSQLIVQLRQP